MEMAWRRILWGKLVNAGQTCVAPDYVLCTPKVQQTLIDSANKIIKEFYGEQPKNSADFSRIVNQKHFDRISKLIASSGKPVIGGVCDPNDRYISPTILTDVSPSDPIMVCINKYRLYLFLIINISNSWRTKKFLVPFYRFFR
jgi:acyl-CoA reductase-like NAD-dependent aldehyde dehydrogenase